MSLAPNVNPSEDDVRKAARRVDLQLGDLAKWSNRAVVVLLNIVAFALGVKLGPEKDWVPWKRDVNFSSNPIWVMVVVVFLLAHMIDMIQRRRYLLNNPIPNTQGERERQVKISQSFWWITFFTCIISYGVGGVASGILADEGG